MRPPNQLVSTTPGVRLSLISEGSESQTEIRPYMYRASMTLVEIHAQVSRVAEGLLDRVLHALVEDAADEALRSFQQVKRFGMGGMLRVGVNTVAYLGICLSSTSRRLLKLNSCIKRWPVMFRLQRRGRFPNCTTRYPWRMPDDQGTRIYRGTLTT